MAFKKKTSPVLEQAKKRRDALAGIDPAQPNFDLGNGLTRAAYNTEIDLVADTVTKYNQALQQADDLANLLKAQEKPLKALSVRMLSGAKSKWGADSSQYELAGGTRTSEFKRKPRNTTPTT